ncbi:MAG: 23S ribosomal RNA methyltransferase Erm [Lachnospiraceae bacterium]|nr:23S ribosomal RNA methyltransferase Erm [Lachnospiraceae bacterium]
MSKNTKHDYVTKVSYSQNFITDRKLINRIVHLSNIDKNDTVLEIGTGKGHLTEALCREGRFVYSVEIDRRLYESTREKLSRYSNLNLIHGDFLNYSLPKKGDYKVYANIPYFITTQIVEKLTQVSNLPADIWLVMEKGAAKRFMGLPRETEKSLMLKVCWDMEILYRFRREDFHPMPSVDSVLIHFSRKAVPDLNKKERYAFKRFVEHCMKYGICGKCGLLTKRQVSAALKRAGLPDLPENGATLYIQWLCLFRWYQGYNIR